MKLRRIGELSSFPGYDLEIESETSATEYLGYIYGHCKRLTIEKLRDDNTKDCAFVVKYNDRKDVFTLTQE